jgi:hypothetical protein
MRRRLLLAGAAAIALTLLALAVAFSGVEDLMTVLFVVGLLMFLGGG